MQTNTFKLLFSVAGLLLLAGCIKKYEPLVKKYENALVVDGTLTNTEGPHTVRLSRAARVDSPAFFPVTNAAVRIMSGQGKEVYLQQQEAGVYKTAGEQLKPLPGNKYKLVINLPDEQTYQSEYITMPEPVGIDSVYGSYTEKIDDYTGEIKNGYQFYINTEMPENDSTYLMWRNHETYEYNSPFYIQFTYQGFFESFPDRDSLYTCWKTNHLTDILLLNSTHYHSNVIRDYPLNFTKLTKFAVKYSFLARQFSVTRQAYNYWHTLKQQNEEKGTFYTRQPYQVRGNVSNTKNPDEPVLGYFVVAGVSRQRIFLSHPGAPTYQCVPDQEAIGFSRPSSWPLYIVVTSDGHATAPEQCFDCRLRGGSLEKPDFWDK